MGHRAKATSSHADLVPTLPATLFFLVQTVRWASLFTKYLISKQKGRKTQINKPVGRVFGGMVASESLSRVRERMRQKKSKLRRGN